MRFHLGLLTVMLLLVFAIGAHAQSETAVRFSQNAINFTPTEALNVGEVELFHDNGSPDSARGWCYGGGSWAEYASLFSVDQSSIITGTRVGLSVSNGINSEEDYIIRFYSVGDGEVPEVQIGPDVPLNASGIPIFPEWRWFAVVVPNISVPAGDFFMVLHHPDLSNQCVTDTNWILTDSNNDHLPDNWFLARAESQPIWKPLRDEHGLDNYYMRVTVAPGEACDYCLTDSNGYLWCLNTMSTSFKGLTLLGTVDVVGCNPSIATAVAVYLAQPTPPTLALSGIRGSSGYDPACPEFMFNTRFISTTRATGLWSNEVGGYGDVTVDLVDCGAPTSDLPESAGSGPGSKQ